MDIVSLCIEQGAYKAEQIPVSKLTFSPELRPLCEQNACGCYGANYACPPHIGEVHALIQRVQTFKNAVIWQNIAPLADSFDFEGMMKAMKNHNAMTSTIAGQVYNHFGRDKSLVLGAGGCSVCDTCAMRTNEPCRHPDLALASLEAYGMNVSKITEASSMKYINGQNTVTYFSGAFW